MPPTSDDKREIAREARRRRAARITQLRRTVLATALTTLVEHETAPADDVVTTQQS